MRILYQNQVPSSSINALTENPTALFSTAFADTRLSRTGKTLDDTSQWIRFDLGSAKNITDCALIGTNLQSSATVSIKANSTDSWGSPPFSATLSLYDDVWYAVFDQTYRYWRLEINDSTNPDTYLILGMVYLGLALTMPGHSTGPELPKNTTSVQAFSESGQVFGTPRLDYKTASFNFDSITETEKTSVDTMYSAVRNLEPIVMIPWEDTATDPDTGINIEPPMYCVLTDNRLRWRKVPTSGGISWSVPLNFREVF